VRKPDSFSLVLLCIVVGVMNGLLSTDFEGTHRKQNIVIFLLLLLLGRCPPHRFLTPERLALSACTVPLDSLAQAHTPEINKKKNKR